jgi:hypothetical protein
VLHQDILFAHDDVVEEIEVTGDLHSEVIGDLVDDSLVRDAPDHTTRVSSHLLDVRSNPLTKGGIVLDDRDLGEGLGAHAWRSLLLLAEVLRDAGIAMDHHATFKVLGHGFQCLERASEGRDVHDVGMPVLLDQVLGPLGDLPSPMVIQMSIVPVDVIATVVAVSYVEQRAYPVSAQRSTRLVARTSP